MKERLKPVILIFTAYYLPGYRGGGPIRSIANFIEHFSDEYEFVVVTSDRDLGDRSPYAGVEANRPSRVGNASVFYISPSLKGLMDMIRVMRATKYNLVYLNSFFDPRFSIFPAIITRIGLAPRGSILIAPRGEFSEGAMKIKRLKKIAYISLSSTVRLYKNVMWHASTTYEASDIVREVDVSSDLRNVQIAANIFTAPDLCLPNSFDNGDSLARDGERKGGLNVCFLSRLSPKKNLDFALTVMKRVRLPVEFSIYGPKEDSVYWNRCQRIIDEMPENINVTYHGEVPHAQVHEKLSKHDIFFLPTRGENFGHVFVEAWAAGLLVLVSDQTPWRDLKSQGVGWDIDLSAPEKFAQALESVGSLDDQNWMRLKRSCVDFALRVGVNKESLAMNKRLLESVVE